MTKPNYEVIETPMETTIIKAEFDNGVVLCIPADESNSDYRRYLRWLENPDAQEGGTL